MAKVAKKADSVMEAKYEEIMELFGLAEDLAATVESDAVRDQIAQMQLVEPVIDTIGDSADILTEEFIACCEGKRAKRPASKSRIEGALRRVYLSIHEYQQRVAQAGKGAMNIADAIVEKIKRQMETIVANFMEFIALSLDRIMQKHDIDDLKQRQERIAVMLHAQAIGQAT